MPETWGLSLADHPSSLQLTALIVEICHMTNLKLGFNKLKNEATPYFKIQYNVTLFKPFNELNNQFLHTVMLKFETLFNEIELIH